MVDLNKLKMSIDLGRITKAEAIEEMRKSLVYAMRVGDRFVLNCGKYSIDFITYFTDPANFPTDLIFNYHEWRKEDNYKKVVRTSEDVDILGNLKCYLMHDEFDIVIVHDVEGATKEND